MTSKFLVLLLLIASSMLGLIEAHAQTAVNAGRKFAFGIPEGPDRQVDSTVRSSRIFLSFLGTTDGCAVVDGPNGFSATVNFAGSNVREIELPNAYMQKWEEGFNQKGFIVQSTQPIHLEMHVLFEGASESTQIFPMEMLDGNYTLSGWKNWNDAFANESNRAQFLVTAAEDNTQVTVTAPNGLLPNVAAGSTFTVTLNAGECYIGKMDTTLNTGLTTSRVIVSATKPVNVIQANTCGYVPYAVQSCNMLLDNVLPRKYFGTQHYLQPISRDVGTDHVILTSDNASFSAIITDGTFYQTSNGRLEIVIDEPTLIESDVPVMCQILTPGSSLARLGLSDPTWVTVPPLELWDDTLVWYAPPTLATMQPFLHYVMIAGPQSAFSEIMLDNALLSTLTTASPIANSTFFTAQVGVPQGRHIVSSPLPVSVIANGIADFDGYSMMTGGTKLNRFQPRPAADLSLDVSEAQYCTELNAELLNSLTISTADQLIEVIASIKYDPAVLRLVSAIPGSFFQSLPGIAIDASRPGTIELIARPGGYLTGTGTLIDAVFAVDGDVTGTVINGSLTLTNDEICDNTRTFNISVPVTIIKVIETAPVEVKLSDFQAQASGIVSNDLILSGLPLDANVRDFSVTIDHNRDVIALTDIDQVGSVTATWNVTQTEETATRTRINFTAAPGEVLRNGILAKLKFKAFLADTGSTDVTVVADLPNSRKCPLVLALDQSVAFFNTELVCGDMLLRNLLKGQTLVKRIAPNPASSHLMIEFERPVSGILTLFDVQGIERMSWNVNSATSFVGELSASLPSGTYTLQVSCGGVNQDLHIVIQK